MRKRRPKKKKKRDKKKIATAGPNVAARQRNTEF